MRFSCLSLLTYKLQRLAVDSVSHNAVPHNENKSFDGF